MKVFSNPKKYTTDILRNLLQEIQNKLIKLDEKGYELFQLDESIFNGLDFSKKAWSNVNQNINF